MEEQDDGYTSYTELDRMVAQNEGGRYPNIPLASLVYPANVRPGLWFAHYDLDQLTFEPYKLKGTVLSEPNEMGYFGAILDTGKRARLNLQNLGIVSMKSDGYSKMKKLGLFTCRSEEIDHINNIVLFQ